MQLTKKAFTWSVVLLTILWSMGVAALVAPAAAQAAECPEIEAGDLISPNNDPAVYLVTSDMKRLYFPNAEVYKTWFADYSGVMELDPACVSQLSLKDGVVYRAGSRMVKVPAFDPVFAVLPNGDLVHIDSEASAAALYGANWASLVRDLPEVFWLLYNETDETLAAELHDGQLVKVSGSATVYYMWDGMLHEVEGTLPAFLTADVRTVAQSLVDDSEMADETVTPASIVASPAQSADSADEDEDEDGDGETPAPAGSLSVALAADTPAATKVPINVDNVVFGKFLFKASTADVTVNSVKLGRKGLGSTGDFTSVTFYDGDMKLGSSRTSWDSDNTMTYNLPGGWKITAGSTKELTVVAKLDTSGTYNAIGVLSSAVSGGTVSGLPVYANEMTGVSTTIGQVTITNTGTSATKKIGVNETTLAQFKLAVNSTEDARLHRITLKNKAASNNAADNDVANLSLYVGSTMIAGPVSMVSDKITFVIDEPYLIKKSKNETFTVKGDVVNGDGNTIEFLLDTTTDLKMIGDTYETNLTVSSDDFNDATDTGVLITIDGAEMNVSYTGENKDTVDDRTDISFGTLTLSSGATDAKITNFVMGVDETDGNSSATDNKDVDNLELVDIKTGAVYSGTMTLGGDTDADSEVWTFSDEIYLTAGEARSFTIQGDLPDGIGNGDSYKVTSTITTSNLTAETVPAGDSISNFSIGSFTGKLVTVKSPTLKVTGITQLNGTAVVNDADVLLFKGTLEAQADDIRVTYADFDANTVFSTANWTQVGFYTATNTEGPWTQRQLVTNSSMTTGTMAFDSLDFTVKSGSANKVYFLVKGTVAASLNGATTANLKLDYFTAKDSENSSALVQDNSGSDLSGSGTPFLTTGARQISLADKGKLYIQMRNNDAGFNKDRIMLAGSSFWAGKLKFRADDEDIKIKDLKLTNVDTSSVDDASSVCLYRAAVVSSENLIGCTTIVNDGTNDVAFFDDIDEVVSQGTEYWYIYVNTAPMSNLAAGTADTHDYFQFKIASTTTSSLAVEGVRSGFTFTYAGDDGSAVAAGEYAFDISNDDAYNADADGATANTKQFVVAGTRISNVQFVSSQGGEQVDTTLSGTGEYTAAIVAVTTEGTSNTDSSGNALRTLLTNIRFDVSRFASTTINTATIERIGGQDGELSLTVADANDSTKTTGTLSVDLSGFTNDHKIEPGTTVYYVVKANVNGINTGDNIVNWFRLNFDDLKGTYNVDTNNNLDWKDGYSSTAFNALLLDAEKITGTKVAELN